jgi:hypothetical protein
MPNKRKSSTASKRTSKKTKVVLQSPLSIPEILVKILSFLDIEDLVENCMLVNLEWTCLAKIVCTPKLLAAAKEFVWKHTPRVKVTFNEGELFVSGFSVKQIKKFVQLAQLRSLPLLATTYYLGVSIPASPLKYPRLCFTSFDCDGNYISVDPGDAPNAIGIHSSQFEDQTDYEKRWRIFNICIPKGTKGWLKLNQDVRFNLSSIYKQ